jgi:RNA polymerase sigma-70 factor, ECF subfamily
VDDPLGCTVPAFWVRLHRARRRLAKALDSPPSPSRSFPAIAKEATR